MLLNHATLAAAGTLPLTRVDHVIPFWPWTVWPYLALITSEAILPLLIRRGDVMARLALAYCLATPINFLTFYLLPIRYERPDAPTGPGVSNALYRLLIEVDTASCCFPSAHIVGPAIVLWSLWCDRQRHGIWLLLGFVLGAASILTTKQHYLWDLLAGLILAAVCLGIAWRVSFASLGPKASVGVSPR